VVQLRRGVHGSDDAEAQTGQAKPRLTAKAVLRTATA
jgi:hypothetical protein